MSRRPGSRPTSTLLDLRRLGAALCCSVLLFAASPAAGAQETADVELSDAETSAETAETAETDSGIADSDRDTSDEGVDVPVRAEPESPEPGPGGTALADDGVAGGPAAPAAAARAIAQTADWVPYVGSNEVQCTMGNPDPWGAGICGSHHSYTGAIDIAMPMRTVVRAAGRGEVVYVNNSCVRGDTGCESGAGRWVGIEHPDGKVSQYMHLDSVTVTVGGQVTRGQQIGLSGDTGNATLPHTHYAEQKPLWTKSTLGTMSACHGSTRVAYPDVLGYSTWAQVPYGSIIRNDGYGCLAGPPPPPPPCEIAEICPAAGGFDMYPFTVNGSYEQLAGDFDGDGADDVLWYAPGTASDSIWWGASDRSFDSGSVVVNGAYQPAVVDFDGNGVDDIFWYAPGPAADSLWLGGAGGSFSSVPVTVNGTYTTLAGDFDGDGFGDIFWYRPGSGSDSIWFGGPGASFTSVGYTVASTYTPVAGDFDGNGAGDIFWYRPGSGSDSIWYGSASRVFSSTPYTVNGTYRPVAGDFEGNGVDDIFWYGTNDYIWYGSPVGFLGTVALGVDDGFVPTTGDFDGNGGADLFWYRAGSGADGIWFAR